VAGDAVDGSALDLARGGGGVSGDEEEVGSAAHPTGKERGEGGARGSQGRRLTGSGSGRNSARRRSSVARGQRRRSSDLLSRLSLRRGSTSGASRRGLAGEDGDEEERKIDRMIGSLTPEQVEQAARTSYAYLIQRTAARGSSSKDVGTEISNINKADEEEELVSFLRSMQLSCARDMARRYLRSNRNNDPVAALSKLQTTLQFRQDLDVDGLRTAFSFPAETAPSSTAKNNPNTLTVSTSPEDPAVDVGDRFGTATTTVALSPYREPLLKRLADKAVYVAGYDVQGRSTFVFEPRRVVDHDDEWTIKQHVYTLERAVACSRAEDRTVNAVVNFNQFSYRNAPPTHLGQQFFTTLRSHYAGHVHQIFLVDAPTAFYCLWTLLKPFIGRSTRSKIQFVSSESQKRSVVGRYYKASQAARWMLPHGEKNRELDLDEYLFRTPFDKAFDEE
jgi:hypothetical protein